MKIGITSDTHSHELPKQMLEDFKNVDMIIHSGDFCSVDDLNKLKKVKEVKGVYGNMDDGEVRKLLPAKQVLKLDKFSIGICHGAGAPTGLLKFVQNEFKNDKVDVVVFGHSHRVVNEKIDGVLYLNPGSPNDMVTAPFCSYIILELTDKIKVEMVKVK